LSVVNAWSTWWHALCAAAIVNIIAWCWSAWTLRYRRRQHPGEVLAVRRELLLLSAVYVVGCAFRSVFPMVDVPRMCLHDTWISRIAVGRSVATIAELCFVMQWALLLREIGIAGGSAFTTFVSRAIVPLIVAAEICSWLAVLTTNYLLHAAENSLWTLAAALALAGFVSVWPNVDARTKRVLGAASVCGVGYIAFMVTVDVPMYLSRWHADVAAGPEYLSLSQGIDEILRRCVVTRDWAAWRPDVPWLTLYFTVAVWISIAFAHVPPAAAAIGRK
jgi:hypothetical protein